MTSIGVLCAMEKEYDLLFGYLHNRKQICSDMFTATTEEHGGRSLTVLRCGIGKVNAAVSTRRLINRGVMNVLSIGVAGALEETLKAGDIVIGNSYCYHDVWCGDPNMPGQVQGFPAVFPSSFGKWMDKFSRNDNIRLGTIASGDWFVQTKEKAEEIKSFLPGVYNLLAVDMESAAIAQVCYGENIPFMSIRVISDNPLLPCQQEQYDGFWDDVAKKSFDTLYNIIR